MTIEVSRSDEGAASTAIQDPPNNDLLMAVTKTLGALVTYFAASKGSQVPVYGPAYEILVREAAVVVEGLVKDWPEGVGVDLFSRIYRVDRDGHLIMITMPEPYDLSNFGRALPPQKILLDFLSDSTQLIKEIAA